LKRGSEAELGGGEVSEEEDEGKEEEEEEEKEKEEEDDNRDKEREAEASWEVEDAGQVTEMIWDSFADRDGFLIP
jgi:hypothetical protein